MKGEKKGKEMHFNLVSTSSDIEAQTSIIVETWKDVWINGATYKTRHSWGLWGLGGWSLLMPAGERLGLIPQHCHCSIKKRNGGLVSYPEKSVLCINAKLTHRQRCLAGWRLYKRCKYCISLFAWTFLFTNGSKSLKWLYTLRFYLTFKRRFKFLNVSIWIWSDWLTNRYKKTFCYA